MNLKKYMEYNDKRLEELYHRMKRIEIIAYYVAGVLTAGYIPNVIGVLQWLFLIR